MAGSGTRMAVFGAALALGIGVVGAAPATAGAPAGAPAVTAAPAAVRVSDSAQAADRHIAKVDRAFLVAAHDSNLNEILAGRLALKRATDKRVRALARMFIEHHTLLDRQVRQVAGRLQVRLPNEPSAQTQLELALLAQFSGARFNRAWLTQQLIAHARAIVLTQIELTLGRQRLVLTLAAAAAPVIQQHYRELRSLAARYCIHAPALADVLALVPGRHHSGAAASA
jgi:putative membrane protein